MQNSCIWYRCTGNLTLHRPSHFLSISSLKRMLKRARFNASLIAGLISGRTRSVNGLQSRNSYTSSSSHRIPTTVQWSKLHTAIYSKKQSLEFPSQAIDVVETLKTSLPTTSEDDDEFNELGPSVSGGSGSASNLANEKPKDKVFNRIFIDHLKSTTKTSQEQDQCGPGTHFHVEGRKDTSRSRKKARKQKFTAHDNQNHTSSLSISIDNIPPSISPLELREAISVYGEILSSSIREGEDGLSNYHAKFKTLESKKAALAARWITLKNNRLPIRGVPHYPNYISIRINNISLETTEVAIHSVCTSYGHVLGLARAKIDAVDVVFRVEDMAVTQIIVKHLNDVVIDDRRWSAKLLADPDQTPATNATDPMPIGSQINSHLESFRNQFSMQRIYLEDLENLHHAVLHLRDKPSL